MNAAGQSAVPEHRRPLSVLVIVYTKQGEVLLLRRSRPFDFWQSVTGSLQPGESHAEAAERELREETGLSGCDLRFSGTSCEWLLVAGMKTRYKGEGTINGGGRYGFMINRG